MRRGFNAWIGVIVMNSELLEDILSCPSLPSLPAIAVKIVEMTQDPDVSMADLAELIQNDQGLSAKILRTVNSSFYSLRQKCASINKAIVLLGLSPVKSLALGFSLVDGVGTKGDDGFDYISYWRRGLYTAIAAKLFAHTKCVEHEDSAFVGGLLQDVGSMAMFRALKRDYLDVMAKTQGDHTLLARNELATFDLCHPDIGSMLASRWRLPDELSLPVKYHERPTAAPQEWATLTKCIGMGNLVHDVLTNEDSAKALRLAYERGKSWLGLTNSEVDAVVKASSTAAKELSSLFKLQTGEKSDADSILAQAGEQLVKLAQDEVQGRAAGSPKPEPLTIDGAEYDPISGAFTKPAFDRILRDAFDEARTKNEPVGVVMMFLDGLKEVHAAKGEGAFDQAVIACVAFARKHFEQAGGAVVRMSDDLFACVINSVSRQAAQELANTACADMHQLSAHWSPGDLEKPWLRPAIGVAIRDDQSAAAYVKHTQLVAAALAAADAARKAGGNCVKSFVPRIAA